MEAPAPGPRLEIETSSDAEAAARTQTSPRNPSPGDHAEAGRRPLLSYLKLFLVFALPGFYAGFIWERGGPLVLGSGQSVPAGLRTVAGSGRESDRLSEREDLNIAKLLEPAAHESERLPAQDGHESKSFPEQDGHGSKSVPEQDGEENESLPDDSESVPEQDGYESKSLPDKGKSDLEQDGYDGESLPQQGGHESEALPQQDGHEPEKLPDQAHQAQAVHNSQRVPEQGDLESEKPPEQFGHKRDRLSMQQGHESERLSGHLLHTTEDLPKGYADTHVVYSNSSTGQRQRVVPNSNITIPPPPKELRCTIRPTTSKPGPGNHKPFFSARLEAKSDASLSSLVAFYFFSPTNGRQRLSSFLGVTAAVQPDGRVEASIASLSSDWNSSSNSNSGSELPSILVIALALAKLDTEGFADAWSAASEEAARCEVLAAATSSFSSSSSSSSYSSSASSSSSSSTSSSASSSSSSSSSGNGPVSHWITVYRASWDRFLPDFLDQHNAADEVASGRLFLFVPPTGTWARYCVEVLDVALGNVSTNELPGVLNDSPWADYQSCVRGKCFCPGVEDRVVGRLPFNKTRCGFDCCSQQSLDQSARYVGRMAVKLPTIKAKRPLEEYPVVTSDREGYFYSFPGASRCRPGQRLGDGCTWRREDSFALGHPDGHQARKNLVRWGHSQARYLPANSVLENSRLLADSFQHLPLSLPPCGEL